ncbi:MAG: ABC transporter ATP-binding protein [Burkholderiaceae bacterium]
MARVRVHGRIAPLIEVGAGFVPDFTGRENVYLNGSILGMSRKEIDRKFDEIVDFAEMAEFIDTPVKRYSSGMQVKLAFAVATSIESEILIVDEVLAVGDLAFQRKCFDRMEQLIKREQRTVLLVSHNIRQVERLCSRVVLMNHGRVLQDGASNNVCNAFYDESDKRIAATNKKATATANQKLMSSGEVDLDEINIIDGNGEITNEIEYLADAVIKLKLRVNKPIKHACIGIGVHTTDFIYLATKHTPRNFTADVLPIGIYSIRCKIKKFPFLPRTYALRVGVAVGETKDTAFYIENALVFRVTSQELNRSNPDLAEGFTELQAEWAEIENTNSENHDFAQITP